jgi:hypothetical protein
VSALTFIIINVITLGITIIQSPVNGEKGIEGEGKIGKLFASQNAAAALDSRWRLSERRRGRRRRRRATTTRRRRGGLHPYSCICINRFDKNQMLDQ